MKKIVALVLILVFMLSLVACGGTTATEPTSVDNGIELTIDNYQKYFEIEYRTALSEKDSVYVTQTHKGSDGFTIGELYPNAYLYMSVKAVSNNYNYEDVVFVVKSTAKAECYSGDNPLISEGYIDYELECKVECNVAGNGENTVYYTLPKLGYKIHDQQYELVSVSGKLTPV